jgi:AraC family transcriptional regulator
MNYDIIRKLWENFNLQLRHSDLPKQAVGNWEKYGITYKEGDSYKYFCGIPVSWDFVNQDFEERMIVQSRYMLFRHTGAMYNLKSTFNTIYKEVIPNGKLTLNQSEYFHFERYSYQFKWNRSESIIEIYVPIIDD